MRLRLCLALLIALLPANRLRLFAYRRLLGYEIGAGSRIGPFNLIACGTLRLGPGATIGRWNVLRGAFDLSARATAVRRPRQRLRLSRPPRPPEARRARLCPADRVRRRLPRQRRPLSRRPRPDRRRRRHLDRRARQPVLHPRRQRPRPRHRHRRRLLRRLGGALRPGLGGRRTPASSASARSSSAASMPTKRWSRASPPASSAASPRSAPPASSSSAGPTGRPDAMAGAGVLSDGPADRVPRVPPTSAASRSPSGRRRRRPASSSSSSR